MQSRVEITLSEWNS